MTALLAASVLSGCSASSTTVSGVSSQIAAGSVTAISYNSDQELQFEFDDQDLETSWDPQKASNIILNGSSIAYDGKNAIVENNKITITTGGTYVISGTLTDGQILVYTDSSETVRLILNGASITSLSSAPIYVMKAERTIITLAEGTVNTLTDPAAYTGALSGEDDLNAALFSKGDLTLNGSGTLKVNGNYKHGIVSKDDLRITGGTYEIHAVSDAIRGRDLIAVREGNFEIEAGSDGLQSNNDEDPEKGFIYIEGGTFKIRALADGLQAQTVMMISGGDFDVESGGGSANGVQSGPGPNGMGMGERPAEDRMPRTKSNPPTGGMPARPESETGASQYEDQTSDEVITTSAVQTTSEAVVSSGDSSGPVTTVGSAKGLKAGTAMIIDGGVFKIDSADDSLHSNGIIEIRQGEIRIASGDDGIHADSQILIQGGIITIEKSYEGIESAKVILQGGEVVVNATDDGVNTSGGADGSSVGGRAGQNGFDSDDGSFLRIECGYLAVNAMGDGIDVNGSMEMTGGTVVIQGPTNTANGAIDYNGDFEMTGGWIIATGSSGMVQGPGASSTTLAAQLYLTPQEAGTLIHIESESGMNIATFKSSKAFSSVVIASPAFEQGASYKAFTGGTSTGEEKDGLITGGLYTGGTEVLFFTLSGVVTQATQEGAAGAGGMGGMGGMRR